MVQRLAWDVEIQPVNVGGQVARDYQGLVRNDNQDLLSITKKSYHPATNEVLMETCERLRDLTGFTLEGYNTFDGGRKVFGYLRNTDQHNIGDFAVDSYMLIGSSFDKTRGFFVGNVDEVLRCKNQFGRISVKTNIRHNSRLHQKLDDLVLYYKHYLEEQARLNKKFTAWQGIRIPEELKELFIDEVLEIDPLKVSAIKRNQKESLFASVNNEMREMGSTAYGMFNGLTHFTTHKLHAKEKVLGNPFGHAATLNQRGLKFVEEYAASL